jgi:hypothetical protein
MQHPVLCILFAGLVLALSTPSTADARSGFKSGYGAPALLLSPAQFTVQRDANGVRAEQDLPVRLPGDSPRPDSLVTGFELPDEPDWDGIKKDTAYFLFSQFFVIGILYVMPEDLSGWSDEQKDDFRFSKWRDNVRDIVWDSDRWWINYILHPYWGGAYYVRAIERGYGEDEAFWYSVLLSTIYEYGAEALFETPSIQDMILTPGLGFFVGKYMMSLRNDIRAQLRAGHELTAGDRAILFVTDPLGSVNKAFDRMFGIRGDYMFSPFMVAPSGQVPFHPDDIDEGPRTASADTIVPGLQLNLRW